ncbi:hypothetical protein [Amycolatopsis sp. cmx-4-54]|uniref:hypothetical protein n=1 Tax=Amycolatopsis sp. cmx-4-54 TaxID=2790936 RepID=UPI0039795D9D
MLEEALVALAAAGGTALVEAAATDAWTKTKERFARFLGRGDQQQALVVEGRLERTHTELLPLTGAELQRAREVRATEWATRLRDVLEEHPESADELRGVVEQSKADGVSVTAVTGDHSVVVGGDSTTSATSGGVAAQVIHGNVSTSGNPPQPGTDQD